MTKKGLCEEVAFQLGLPRGEARQAVDVVFGSIADALKNGEEVKIKDFCSMHVVEKAERKYRNRETWELQITAPGKRLNVNFARGLH